MPKVEVGVIARFVALVGSLVLTGSTIFFCVEMWTEILTLGLTIVASFWAFWKDNDVTKKARYRTEKCKELEKWEADLREKEKMLIREMFEEEQPV